MELTKNCLDYFIALHSVVGIDSDGKTLSTTLTRFSPLKVFGSEDFQVGNAMLFFNLVEYFH